MLFFERKNNSTIIYKRTSPFSISPLTKVALVRINEASTELHRKNTAWKSNKANIWKCVQCSFNSFENGEKWTQSRRRNKLVRPTRHWKKWTGPLSRFRPEIVANCYFCQWPISCESEPFFFCALRSRESVISRLPFRRNFLPHFLLFLRNVENGNETGKRKWRMGEKCSQLTFEIAICLRNTRAGG